MYSTWVRKTVKICISLWATCVCCTCVSLCSNLCIVQNQKLGFIKLIKFITQPEDNLWPPFPVFCQAMASYIWDFELKRCMSSVCGKCSVYECAQSRVRPRCCEKPQEWVWEQGDSVWGWRHVFITLILITQTPPQIRGTLCTHTHTHQTCDRRWDRGSTRGLCVGVCAV